MKKIILIIFTFILTSNAFADQKTMFARSLMNGINIIDNAYWRNNNLLVFIEVSDTWSGADTYRTAELICETLFNQGFTPVSNYTVSMIEKTGQSELLKMKCK